MSEPTSLGLDSIVLWQACRSNEHHDALNQAGVQAPLFGLYPEIRGVEAKAARKAWSYIGEHREMYGEVPRPGKVAAKFDIGVHPPGDDPDREEPAAALADQMREQAKRRVLEKGVRDLADHMNDGEVDEAIELITKVPERLARLERTGRPVRPRGRERIERLKANWGRQCVGIELPSMPRLTSAISGLRGLMTISAPPNIGKTTLMLSMIAEAIEANEDVACVLVSLELSVEEIEVDFLAMWSGWSTRDVMLGQVGKPLFGPKEDELYEASERLDRLYERLTILTEDVSIKGVSMAIDEIKQRTCATQALAAVDSINSWPLPAKSKLTENQADDYRIKQMLTLKRRIGADATSRNAVVTIAEQRKGQGSEWDLEGLAGVKGSGSGTYKPDVVIGLRQAYFVPKSASVKDRKAEVAAQARRREEMAKREKVSLLEACVLKARKPGVKGDVPITFDFGRSAITEGHSERHVDAIKGEEDDDDEIAY